jgi:hypothetical protein
MMNRNYHVVFACTTVILQDEVQIFLEQGYELAGGIAVGPRPDYHGTWFYQAVYLPRTH